MNRLSGVLAICLTISGCAIATVPCPTSGPPIVATINSSDAALGLQALIGALTTTGVIMAKTATPLHAAAVPAPAAVTGSVSLRTVPFGASSISCGPQATAPTAS